MHTFIRVWHILIMCICAMGATTRDLGPGAPEDGGGTSAKVMKSTTLFHYYETTTIFVPS